MPYSSANTPETRAMQSAAAQKESTLSIAAQASAARLIRYLRQIYPDIQEQIQVQTALLGYLDTVIAHVNSLTTPADSKDNIVLPKASELEHPHLVTIHATVRMIHRIAALQSHSQKDKLRMFRQMQSIAATCPGIRWDKEHEQWSQNKIYNGKTKQDEIVMASPAETLNLVCAAMFDEARHVLPVADLSDNASTTASSSHTTQTNIDPIQDRVHALASELLALQLEIERGEMEKCSAGRQHDMLFLLNRSFLDEHNKPIELIEDVQSFLMGAISKYLKETMEELSKTKREALMWDWMQWKPEVATTVSPVLQWLRAQYPSASQDIDTAWQQVCHDFVVEQCVLFGINPTKCPIAGIVAGLPYLTLPFAKDVKSLLITELLRTKAVALIPVAASINTLIAARNQALETFQQKSTFELWHKPEYKKALRDFYTAEHFFGALLAYIRPMTLVGDSDTAFKAARDNIQTALQNYYQSYDLSRHLPENFKQLKLDYLAQEQSFRKEPYIDAIRSFFAGLSRPEQLAAHYTRLRAVITSPNNVRQVKLSDTNIQQWLTHSSAIDETGQLVSDLSTDEVNHILLQAFCMRPQRWSPIFKQALLLVSRWLLEPVYAEDSASLIGLKQAYPRFFVSNLRFMALLQDSAAIDADIRAKYQNLSLKDIFYTDILSYLLKQTSRTQGEQIWTVLTEELSILIRHSSQFYSLANLPCEKSLSAIQIDTLFNMIRPHLDILLQEDDAVFDLFTLMGEHLTAEQSDIVLAIVESDLPYFISTNRYLYYLFKEFTLEQLTSAQRDRIIAALAPELAARFVIAAHGSDDGGDLSEMLGLSMEQLTSAQREIIWTAITPTLDTSIIRCSYDLYDIFKLSLEQVSMPQRDICLAAIAAKPDDFSKDEAVFYLFSLSLAQFTTQQRTLFLKTFMSKLIALMQDEASSALLYELFSLSLEQLTVSQRHDIWTAIAPYLSTIVTNITGCASSYLVLLFSFSLEQLTALQRDNIWAVIMPHLTTMITHGLTLGRLLSLSLEQLTVEQRKVLWIAITPHLDALTKDPESFLSLLVLALNQFKASLGDGGLPTQNELSQYHELFLNALARRLDKLTTSEYAEFISVVTAESHFYSIVLRKVDYFLMEYEEEAWTLFDDMFAKRCEIQRPELTTALKSLGKFAQQELQAREEPEETLSFYWVLEQEPPSALQADTSHISAQVPEQTSLSHGPGLFAGQNIPFSSSSDNYPCSSSSVAVPNETTVSDTSTSSHHHDTLEPNNNKRYTPSGEHEAAAPAKRPRHGDSHADLAETESNPNSNSSSSSDMFRQSSAKRNQPDYVSDDTDDVSDAKRPRQQ